MILCKLTCLTTGTQTVMVPSQTQLSSLFWHNSMSPTRTESHLPSDVNPWWTGPGASSTGQPLDAPTMSDAHSRWSPPAAVASEHMHAQEGVALHRELIP